MQMSALSHEMSSQRKYELFFLRVHRDVKGTRIYLSTCLPHRTWSPWHCQVVPHQPSWQSLESQIPRWHWQHLQVRRGKSGAGAHSGTAFPPPSHPSSSSTATAERGISRCRGVCRMLLISVFHQKDQIQEWETTAINEYPNNKLLAHHSGTRVSESCLVLRWHETVVTVLHKS